MKINLFLISILVIFFTACSKSEDATPTGKYSSGVFVSNEGPFQTGTGTVSFFDRNTRMAENDIFQLVNSRPLGNIVQSIEIHNDKAYMVVNNAKKVEVAQAWDFKSVGVIQDLEIPRFFLGIDEKKGYISQWGVGGVNGAIKVVDLQTNMVTKTINVGKGAERMVKIDNKVFVACGGGFDNENQLFVVDTQRDEVSATISVPDNSNSLVVDSNNKLWVACRGRSQWNGTTTVTVSPAQLIRINPANNQVEQRFTFSRHGVSNLVINASRNTLFYTFSGQVFAQNINDNALNTTPIVRRGFYGLGFDPQANLLYAADAGNFVSNGKVIRYNPNGSAVDSMTVGIAPSGFYFR
jgi:DNA-binding beta-propeller fold protein YncE